MILWAFRPFWARQRLLLLALQLHTAPRLLTVGGSTTALGAVNEGALAGDPQCVLFAKLVNYELLAAMHRAYGSAAPLSYVDDMPMMVVELT